MNDSYELFRKIKRIDLSDNSVQIDSGWYFNWKELSYNKPLAGYSHKNIQITSNGWTEISNYPSFGYGTYSVIISTRSKNLLALLIPSVYSSYKLFINGELVAEMGKVATSKKAVLHKRFTQIIPLNTSDSIFRIDLQIANFYHKKGGLTKPLEIGSFKQINKRKDYKLIADMIYVGSLGFIGLSFLLLHLFYWNKDKAILYFSLFCIFWSYRTLSEGYAPLVGLFSNLDWSVNAIIEYCSLFLGALMGSLFINKLFKTYIHHLYPKLISIVIYIFTFTALFIPSQYLNSLLLPFFSLMGLNMIYIVFILIKALFNKQRESLLALISIALGIFILSFHVFSYYESESNQLIINIGYVAIFLLISMLLGMRFSKSFFKLEKLQIQTLEQKEEIQSQSDQLSQRNKVIVEMNKDLEDRVERRTNKLKATNKELDLFLYKSSHDLLRPVKSLKGLMNLVELTDSKPERETLIEQLNQSLDSMELLLKKLSGIHEILNHKCVIQRIDLNGLLVEIIESIKRKFGFPENLQFEYYNPSEIHSDYFLLKSLLTELLTNSACWAAFQGSLMVTCSITLIENKGIEIIIQDNGPGIPENQLKSIFEMYKVANDKTKTNGLGLYIVKKIVEKLNGSIKIDSKEKGGTLVGVTLLS
jgi:signal transduction histidine kinase